MNRAAPLQYEEIMRQLRAQANPAAVAGMAGFGINPTNTYGVSIPALRGMARQIGRDHQLALRLWASSIHEARILASLVDDPEAVTDEQMEAWVVDFDSWDVCDQCCNNLFAKTRLAHNKAAAWSGRSEEFVRRAGFVLMACLAVHDKQADDATFLEFLSIIQATADDERNFVRKAINWALRQIGKRNLALNQAAVSVAEQLRAVPSKAARWIAADALRELTAEKTQLRLAKTSQKLSKGTT